MGVSDAFGLEDFDRYVEENGIPGEDYPAAFAQWIAKRTGGPAPRFENWTGSHSHAERASVKSVARGLLRGCWHRLCDDDGDRLRGLDFGYGDDLRHRVAHGFRDHLADGVSHRVRPHDRLSR